MLTNHQLDHFHAAGYVLGEHLLDEPQIEALRCELDRVIAEHHRGHAGQVYIEGTAAFCQERDCFLQFTNIRELSAMFDDVARTPTLLRATAAILKTDRLRLFADSILYKNGKNSAVNDWHQDGPAFDILREPEVLTAWIALDDVTPGDGEVCFATGSHRWTDGPAAGRDRVTALLPRDRAGDAPLDASLSRCLLRRGEVHFHHGLTWHCSLPNLTGRPRRGFVVNFIPATAQFNAHGSHFFKRFVECSDGEPFAGKHFPLLRVD